MQFLQQIRKVSYKRQNLQERTTGLSLELSDRKNVSGILGEILASLLDFPVIIFYAF